MSRSAVAMLGTAAPKSSSTVTMTACATSKVESGPEAAVWFVAPAPTEAEPSRPPLLGERAGVRAVVSEGTFGVDCDAPFFAIRKPAQTRIVTPSAAPINQREPRRLVAVEVDRVAPCVLVFPGLVAIVLVA